MATHNKTGAWGEQAATEFLIKAGYTIMERNWRLGHLEVDIIASHGSRVIFVEVKTRSTSFADPADAVTPIKQRRIARAADAYIRHLNLPLEAQFDIVTIIGNETAHIIEHIPDAFLPPLKTYR
ncbi:MAG: YraN family protein [Pseudoflavonifractor sp.]|nr:YraN family protein [Pseudoflavonifractor sp.]